MHKSNPTAIRKQARLGAIGAWLMAGIMLELWVVLLFFLPRYAQISIATVDGVYADPDKFLASLGQHPLLWRLMEPDVFFSMALFLAVWGIGAYLRGKASLLSRLATVAGMIGVGIGLGLGMLESVSNPSLAQLYRKNPSAAVPAYHAVNAVSQALDRGVIFVCAWWMLLASLAGLAGHQLSRWLCYLGIALFLAGMLAPVFPPAGFAGPFLAPVFLIWLGFSAWRNGGRPLHALEP